MKSHLRNWVLYLVLLVFFLVGVPAFGSSLSAFPGEGSVLLAQASKKKKKIAKQYEAKLSKIQAAELKMIARKFTKTYKEEKKREVQLTKVTKNIEGMMAETFAKIGLDKLERNSLLKARKAFVDALYLDSKNETAKSGMKSISSKAKAMYWEAYGQKETNKSKARKLLRQLESSLLPTNEYFLKAQSLLDELK